MICRGILGLGGGGGGFAFGGGGGGAGKGAGVGRETSWTGDSTKDVPGSRKLALGFILIFGVCLTVVVDELGLCTSLLVDSPTEWFELDSLSFSGGMVSVIRLWP